MEEVEEAEEAEEVVEATNKSASAQHIECVSAISYPLSFSVPSTALLAMLPLTVSVPASPIITTVGDPVMPWRPGWLLACMRLRTFSLYPGVVMSPKLT